MKNNNRTNCIIKTDRMGEMLQENFPKASVLIPAYNVEKFLKRSLDSVIAQTYKDFEIILIDDGSVDSTPQICDEYAEKLGGSNKGVPPKEYGIS